MTGVEGVTDEDNLPPIFQPLYQSTHHSVTKDGLGQFGLNGRGHLDTLAALCVHSYQLMKKCSGIV